VLFVGIRWPPRALPSGRAGRWLDPIEADLHGPDPPASERSHFESSPGPDFGVPGGDAVATLQAVGADAFRTLSERFDLIAIDPRGVGRSEAAIDCRVDQETEGLYANPFLKPSNLDVSFWMARAERYVDACVQENLDVSRLVSTANVARDMDLVRAALGEERLSSLGLSYGSFLGATYAALFPQSYRALVLDGALDADQYINRPSEGLREQSAAFEVALGRFFQACEDDADACSGFGGADPRQTFDELVSATNASPVNVPGTGRVLDGDDILMGAVSALYNKASWSVLAESLAALENGDPRPLRAFADASYGREGDGTFAPITPDRPRPIDHLLKPLRGRPGRPGVDMARALLRLAHAH
jgi:pimeloyl-ACP methyl ester carboxylesterase